MNRRGVDQRLVGAGVEPGEAAPQHLHAQLPLLQVDAVDVGDLQLAARRRPQRLGDGHHVAVVEIEADHGQVGPGRGRLFLDGNGPAFGIDLHHAVALGILDRSSRRSVAPLGADGLAQQLGQAVTVKDIVAQDQADGIAGDELLADQEGVGQAARLVLHLVGKTDPQLAAVAQQGPEAGQVGRAWR